MRRRSPLPWLVLLVVLAGCSDASPTGGPASDRPSPTTTAATAPTSPERPDPSAPAGAPTSDAATTPAGRPLEEVTATWRVVGEGHDAPVQVLPAPDGRVLVVEQPGRIRTLGGGEVVLDIADRVTVGREQGLLGAAIAPGGTRLFVHYSGGDGQTVVSVFPWARVVDPASETVLFEHPQPAANHNGGSLLFDPAGDLVLALGDGGGGGDQFGNGQDPGTVLGALLRFQVDGDDLEPAEGNPYVGGGGAPEVWAHGLRNPWRIAFDQDHLYVADVGQGAREEVNVLPRSQVAGANFGWPRLEGTACFAVDDCDPAGTKLPVAELLHADGACAIIGGVVVPEGHPTGLGGAYVYSDRCATQLRALRSSDPTSSVVVDGATVPAPPLGFGTGADGEVWVGTADGQVLELVPG